VQLKNIMETQTCHRQATARVYHVICIRETKCNMKQFQYWTRNGTNIPAKA